MASTGPALWPGASTFPDATVYPGQGTQPIVRCRLSFDDVSTSIPAWTEVATNKLRSFTVDRGRDSELSEFDAGTATVVLDNRDRAYDPTLNSSVRPMNQVWLYEEFTGEVHDLFRGYVESWDQNWPGGGWSDAEAVVSAADEFKRLAFYALPVTDPPSPTYGDVVTFDNPAGYWTMTDDSVTTVQMASIGDSSPLPSRGPFPPFPGPWIRSQIITVTQGQLRSGGAGFTRVDGGGAITGDSKNYYTRITPAGYLTTGDLAVGDPGDPADYEMTIEAWIAGTVPGSSENLILGPVTGGNTKFQLNVTSAGVFSFSVRNSAGTVYNLNGGQINGTGWNHVVGMVRANTVYLYINGVQVDSTAWNPSFTFANTLDAGANMRLGNTTTTQTYAFNHVAFYRSGLSASRVLAHYTAAKSRGFSLSLSGQRIGEVLDVAGSPAPRGLASGVRYISPRYMAGRGPLDVIREALSGESVDAVFFVSASGTLVFLAADHRSSSPYNTVQATFGDAGGAELPYEDLVTDYSDAFLVNEWNVTREDGELQTATDAASIGAYGKRSQTFSSLPLPTDADAEDIAQAMVYKYRVPMIRVKSIKLTTLDPSVTEAFFRRELMDKITVKRTLPGGGARFSQDLYIQKIGISGDNSGAPWSVNWVVSPL